MWCVHPPLGRLPVLRYTSPTVRTSPSQSPSSGPTCTLEEPSLKYECLLQCFFLLQYLHLLPPSPPPPPSQPTQDIQTQLKHRQGIASFLIKPVQRISQYQLLLRDLQKSAQKAGLASTPQLDAALQQMQDVPKRTNDAMTLSMICGYEGAISASGQLIMHVSTDSIES